MCDRNKLHARLCRPQDEAHIASFPLPLSLTHTHPSMATWYALSALGHVSRRVATRVAHRAQRVFASTHISNASAPDNGPALTTSNTSFWEREDATRIRQGHMNVRTARGARVVAARTHAHATLATCRVS